MDGTVIIPEDKLNILTSKSVKVIADTSSRKQGIPQSKVVFFYTTFRHKTSFNQKFAQAHRKPDDSLLV